MFDKILIANRGEIACRVIKTARAMGVKTVAVYSDADAHAMHVAMADEAVRIGPAPVADSYLRGDVIIDAALKTGAQAIHPGYGFLSENPDFVDQLTAAGLVFIGPSANAIRAMGLKDAAKHLMHKAGVPVVPGYHDADQDPQVLAKAADEIGYPVLIKAVAGGGGKGMRLVSLASDFATGLASAQAEAKTAFGNPNVLIEKYIQHPRHIEVQVFGDGEDAVHLFERDCSLQRRHQKVIEEAPAPDMPSDVRAAMCDAAVKAAKAIAYSGAGTIEFIVDGSGPLRTNGFWFMEMNTRLQVEHPVTEAITGVDLVAWQLAVASGAPLPAVQSDIKMSGHAMEARLYAEDVPAGFLPATGPLDHLVFPQKARIDSGVRQGDVVSPWYDPMIAKITVHAADRDAAQRKLLAALEAAQIAGTVTNLAFLQALVADHDFAAGRVDTGLIERRGQSLIQNSKLTLQMIASAAIAVSGDQLLRPHMGFSLWGGLRQSIQFSHQGAQIDVFLSVGDGSALSIEVADETLLLSHFGGEWRAGGKSLPKAVLHGDRVTVFSLPPVTLDVPNRLDRAASLGSGNQITSPMPGLVQNVAVMVGDTVHEGDPLVVLEAMKMEHVLKAPRDGIVQDVFVGNGAQVEAGIVLVTLKDDA